MKKIALLICVILNVAAYGQITFERTYGGVGFNQGFSIVQTNDGGYALTGNNSNMDVYIIRTDQNGDTLWTRTFGGLYNDYGYSIANTNDDGFVVTGVKRIAGYSHVYFIKTNANGDTLWTRTFGNTGVNSVGYSVIQLNDNGYIISGTTDNTGLGQPCSLYIIRADENGDTLWTKTVEGAYDYGCHIATSNDDGYVITGREGNAIILMKINQNGDILWTKNYGGTVDEYANSIINVNNTGYAIVGSVNNFDPGTYDMYLIRTDINGDTLWTRTYGTTEPDMGNSAALTNDGGFIIAGYTGSNTLNDCNFYLVKTDANGDTLWTRTFGGSGYDVAHSVVQTYDDSYIVAGLTESFGVNYRAVYLLKTDAGGIISNSHEIYGKNNDLKIFPNPTTGKINIVAENIKQVEIYNISGIKVKSTNKKEIDLSQQSKGVYLIRVITNKGAMTKKIIIE